MIVIELEKYKTMVWSRPSELKSHVLATILDYLIDLSTTLDNLTPSPLSEIQIQ